MNKKQKFWTCIVGPARREDLPNGADFPMRVAGRNEFQLLSGYLPEICMSGWDNDSETAAKASIKRNFVYAVEKTNTPEPELRKLTSGELLQIYNQFR